MVITINHSLRIKLIVLNLRIDRNCGALENGSACEWKSVVAAEKVKANKKRQVKREICAR